MGRALRSYWDEGDAVERFGYAVGALLVAAGVFHFGVFLVDGGGWQGPVSWRKPTVFGLSFGVTVATITWLTTFLSVGRRMRGVLIVPLAAASAGEVALVSMQQWRGVPSHFNVTTPFDDAIFQVMGLLVMIVGVVVVAVTLLSFVRLQMRSSMRLAVRAGLLLVVAQGVGGAMIGAGTAELPDPAAYTAGAPLKLSHAVTMHGVQILPGLAWLLSYTGWAESRRVRIVALALTGHAGLAAVAIALGFQGAGVLDAGPTLLVVAAVGVVLLAVAAGVTLRAVARDPAPASGLRRQPARPAP
jgi:hypothetical protein